MDELIQKYLDGDLSEEEAAALTEALAGDPALEAELEAFERTIALVSRNVAREPSPAFTDGVMNRVTASARAASRAAARPRARGFGAWVPRLAWAAGFAAVFALGYLSAGRLGGPSSPGTMDAPGTAAVTGTGAPARVAEASAPSLTPSQLRLVRLVYVPRDPDVDRVTVAGTFNGWDPEGTELHKQGGAWIVQMVLPPETYEYMFVEDGEQWVTDPLAMQTRDDGFGRKNAVLDLTL